MKIEILYFAGCPNRALARSRIREALEQEGLTTEITETEVKDAGAALGFPGSPTILVNGRDVEMSPPAVRASGPACRTYLAEHGRSGAPPVDCIRKALRQAAREADT
jgi:hypothetical protein